MHLNLKEKAVIEKVVVAGLLGVFGFALTKGPLMKALKVQRVIPAAASVVTQPMAATAAALTTPDPVLAIATAMASSSAVPSLPSVSSSRKYAAQDFRDPFENQFPVEEQRKSVPTGMATNPRSSIAPGATPPPSAVASVASTSTSALQVQGVIWGGANPKVLINGSVYGINDTVNGATIVAIDHEGVAINRGGTPVYYAPSSPETEGRKLSQATQVGTP